MAIVISLASLIPSFSRSLELNQYLKDDVRTRIPAKIGTYLSPIAMDSASANYTGFNFLGDSLKKEIASSNKLFDKNVPLESQSKNRLHAT